MTTQTNQQIIRQISEEDGVPYWVTESIAETESSNEADAVSPSGDSIGLFQLDTVTGQGKGYTKAELENPTTNAEIGIKPIAKAYRLGVQKGLTGYSLLSYTADHSGHPDETGILPASYAKSLAQSYANVTDKSVQASIPTSSGSGPTGSVGVSGPFAGIETTLLKIFWGMLGVALVLIGIYLLVNPESQLASTLKGAI